MRTCPSALLSLFQTWPTVLSGMLGYTRSPLRSLACTFPWHGAQAQRTSTRSANLKFDWAQMRGMLSHLAILAQSLLSSIKTLPGLAMGNLPWPNELWLSQIHVKLGPVHMHSINRPKDSAKQCTGQAKSLITLSKACMYVLKCK